jgi:hypothetical protein
MVVKTFRGLLADGGQERIRLSTKNGKVGYRIAKFQIMAPLSTGSSRANGVSIWKTEQTSVSTSAISPDFTESDLLAVALNVWDNSQPHLSSLSVIFDNEIFNQDIYITNTETIATGDCNYYIELEAIPLSDQGAEYTTIKDLRANA